LFSSFEFNFIEEAINEPVLKLFKFWLLNLLFLKRKFP